jgi:hypothetical protein
MRAQLRVENPARLRTTWNFDFLPPRERRLRRPARLIYSKASIKTRLKIKTRRYRVGRDTNIARKKSDQHWSENRGGPGVRL